MFRPAVLAAAVLAAVALGAPAASASEGSVPPEVVAYAADPDGLLSRLDEFIGLDADGAGIDLRKGATVGELSRAYAFTDAWAAGEQTDQPVSLLNEWAAPVLLDGEAVGLATIWINPDTALPELSDFSADAWFAAALADVAGDAYVVHDAPRGAWFLLTPPTLVPVLTGTSGATGSMTVDEYYTLVSGASAAPAAGPNLGSVLSVVTIAGVAVLIAVILLVLALRRRRREVAAEPPVA